MRAKGAAPTWRASTHRRGRCTAALRGLNAFSSPFAFDLIGFSALVPSSPRRRLTPYGVAFLNPRSQLSSFDLLGPHTAVLRLISAQKLNFCRKSVGLLEHPARGRVPTGWG